MTTATTSASSSSAAQSYGMSEIAAACKPYRELLEGLRDAAVVDSVRSLLGWDQETMMPPAGADLRSSMQRSDLGKPSREAKAVRHAEAAYSPVGGRHGRGADANEDLVRTRLGPRDVFDLHHVRRSVASDHRRLHVR